MQRFLASEDHIIHTFDMPYILAKMRHQLNVASMLGQRRRWYTNIEPTMDSDVSECTSLHNCVNFVSRFRASLYPCPETAEERNEMAIQVASRLQDLKTVSDPQDIVCLHHISSTNMVLCTIKKLPFVEILPRLCRKQHKAIFTS